MGFVCGSGNNAITTALSTFFFVYCIVNIRQYREFIYLVFYTCPRLMFLDVETDLARLILFFLSAEYSVKEVKWSQEIVVVGQTLRFISSQACQQLLNVLVTRTLSPRTFNYDTYHGRV